MPYVVASPKKSSASALSACDPARAPAAISTKNMEALIAITIHRRRLYSAESPSNLVPWLQQSAPIQAPIRTQIGASSGVTQSHQDALNQLTKRQLDCDKAF